METLVALLTEFEASDFKGNIGHLISPYDNKLVQQIEMVATDLLITKDGQPNYPAIDELYINHYYNVFPIEIDSFGWLGAGIQTKKGYIMFG